MIQSVHVKLLSGTALTPRRAHRGDAGLDLFVSRYDVVPPHQFVDIHTDVAVALPPGTFGMTVSRSSTVRKRGLRVETAIIDNGYRGELFIGVWNLTDKDVEVQVGERLAQLLMLPLLTALPWEPDLLVTEDLPEPEDGRGEDGFGSTGK